MFENKLKDDLQKIFGIKEVTFDLPGESREQDKLFVEVETAPSNFTDGMIHYRVTGTAKVFAQSEKIGFGFFAKAIARAGNDHPGITRNFFFSDMDGNTPIFKNIVQRSFSFVYFFSGQHDPDIGSIESIKTEVITP